MTLKNSSKSKATRIKKQLEQIIPYAAGIDIGSWEHFVSVPGSLDEEPVRNFGSFTVDLENMAVWLVLIGITTVAMESTGIYWIPVFEILEAKGIEVILVNAHHVKIFQGEKQMLKTVSGYNNCTPMVC